jgi:hypothetical protein
VSAVTQCGSARPNWGPPSGPAPQPARWAIAEPVITTAGLCRRKTRRPIGRSVQLNPSIAQTVNIHERRLLRRQRADLFATITATAERIKLYRVTSPAADTLVLTRRVTPTWALVLALLGLLVLLLGLLFLLVRETQVITVRAENVGEGCAGESGRHRLSGDGAFPRGPAGRDGRSLSAA